MLRDRRVVAVIPARGGSKGIPRKNLHKIGGITLVERAIRVARSSPRVDAIYVSTDDAEIFAIAEREGCATPKLRPKELATDSARTIDVMKNLVSEGVLKPEDCLLLLQPTTPLRTPADLEAVCRLLESSWDIADAVISVCEITGAHPYKAQLVSDGYLKSLVSQDASVPRQSLPKTFMPNGAFYLGKLDVFIHENTFMATRALAFVMPALTSINLDSELDLVLLDAVVAKNLVPLE